MAGVVPFSSCPPSRKQWNIRDKKSVRRLQSQLAEDGCPESQLVLAKQLLQEKSMANKSDNEKNACLGVFWLIKASEQGSVEATDILKECLATGEGITEHNCLDVQACLNTSQNEKLARRAAREMFLSLSGGQDYITSEQLRRCISKLHLCSNMGDGMGNGTSNENSLKESATPSSDTFECGEEEDGSNSISWDTRGFILGEKISEDHLERAASMYSRGELPLVQKVLTLTDPYYRSLDGLNYLQRTLLHPLETLQHAYVKILNSVGCTSRHSAFVFLPSWQYLQFLILLLLCPLVSLESMLVLFPVFLYYFTFFAMVVFTLQMLQSKREMSNFHIWSRLFLSYDRGRNLNTEDAEFEYCKKNMQPFAWFFLSLLCNLMVHPFVSERCVSASELAIVALALTFITLVACPSTKLDFLMLFSFGINVLAKYPYESDGVVRQTWRFLDIELPNLQTYGIPCFASYVVGNGIEFCLNFRGVFYLLMPGIFLKMARREAWKGTYKVLIPHCVTLAWWQVAILCCQGATLYGLLRSTLALVGFALFLPLAGVATLVLPAVALLKHLSDAALTPKTGLTSLLAFIPLLLGYMLDKRRGVQIGTSLSKVQMLLAVVAAIFLIIPSLSELATSSLVPPDMPVAPSLSWEQYSSFCHHSSWDKRISARSQVDCSHLARQSVNWEGTLTDVEIIKIHNPVAKLLDYLPEGLRLKLLCLYGEHYPEDCSMVAGHRQQELCSLHKQRSPCHLHTWDKFDFKVSVKVKSSEWSGVESVIHLMADDSLRNMTLMLQPGDHIWFAATLSHPETLGTEPLIMSAEEMGCIKCSNLALTSLKRVSRRWSSEVVYREAYTGLKRVLNFVFNPVVIFR